MEGDYLDCGFASLEFDYIMHKQSIILGRKSTTSTVDVDLAGLGGDVTRISRQHARIDYYPTGHRFTLKALGRLGCYVNGQFLGPEDAPLDLESTNQIRIGNKLIYFLFPVREPSPSTSATRDSDSGFDDLPPPSGPVSERRPEDPARARLPSSTRTRRSSGTQAAAPLSASAAPDEWLKGISAHSATDARKLFLRRVSRKRDAVN